jgi:hypothetical protein
MGYVYLGYATGWPGPTSFNVSHLEIVTLAGLVSRLQDVEQRDSLWPQIGKAANRLPAVK